MSSSRRPPVRKRREPVVQRASAKYAAVRRFTCTSCPSMSVMKLLPVRSRCNSSAGGDVERRRHRQVELRRDQATGSSWTRTDRTDSRTRCRADCMRPIPARGRRVRPGVPRMPMQGSASCRLVKLRRSARTAPAGSLRTARANRVRRSRGALARAPIVPPCASLRSSHRSPVRSRHWSTVNPDERDVTVEIVGAEPVG